MSNCIDLASDAAIQTATVAVVMYELGHVPTEVVDGADELHLRCLGCRATGHSEPSNRDMRIIRIARRRMRSRVNQIRHDEIAPDSHRALPAAARAAEALVCGMFWAIIDIAQRLDNTGLIGAQALRDVIAEHATRAALR